MNGSTRCNYCPRQVRAAEARLSIRACDGRVLCDLCRRRQYPIFPAVHQAPKGCAAEIRPSGYGRFECSLTAPDGRTFTSAAMTDHQALARAAAAARAAGALAQ